MDPIRPRPLTDAAELSMAEAALQREAAIAATKTQKAAEEAGDNRRAREASRQAKAALGRVRVAEIRATSAQTLVLDAVWIEGAQAETVALRTIQGDVVAEITDHADFEPGQRPKFSVRDGLVVLYESGALTLNQTRTGRAYRTMLEALPDRLGSQLAAPGSSRGSDPDQRKRIMAALRRARAAVSLTRVEFEVARLGMREFRVLRWVAGCSGSIHALGQSAGARRANTAALVRALDRAAIAMWRDQHLRIGGN
ncbi:MAG: hypothetical protein JSS35_11295 [Proteobacteria bacterium]|nr:hypothetical protein [Pseudomonadota bacterium]